jgi:hypothetical protein
MSKNIVVYAALSLLLLLAMPPRGGWALTPPEGFAPGPDVIMGNLPSLIQAGSNGTQVGLMMGTDICNNGDVPANWFRLPETDHPVIPQNLYRMSGGPNNDDRFEQIGQSWAMHQFFPLQNNACGFGCTSSPDSAHLGVGCSTADTAGINASQTQVGSRAWINPFTGIFPSTANSHTGHTHDGTMHRILVEGNDLNPAMNPGATYYGEAQLVTAHEYAWCQSHAGECNMFNNVSYRQFMVTATTSFNFAAVGATVRMTPAIYAWPGATIHTIEPEPGVDGRAFIAYKVTNPSPGIWQYDYAIYNQNLDRGIRYFSVPGGCGVGPPTNLEFHAPLNHPGIANDGTVGDAGYSNAPWLAQAHSGGAIWSTEPSWVNPNANAIRWGTLYNFRFRHTTPPTVANALIAFFKTGGYIFVPILGPSPECIPSPSPSATIIDPGSPTPTATATATATASPTPTATATATAMATPPPTLTPTPTPSATPTPSPSPTTKAVNLSTRMRVQTGDGVGIGGFIIAGSAPKSVLVRAIGPSLTGFGVPGALTDPVLELHGPGTFTTVTNNNWRDTQETEIQATGIPPTNNLESAIVAALPAGAYTAIVRGNGNTSGIALIEVYDLNQGVDSRLANISTRAFVSTGDNIVIAGFVLGGNGDDGRIIVRGLGPSLGALGVANALANPTLELRDNNGALLLANNDWQDNPDQVVEIIAAGLAPTNNLESALAAALPPGPYTALLAGLNNGSGIGLVEVYDRGPP